LLWRTREPLSLDALCAELSVSPATAKRLIAVLRDNRGLDLRYQRDGNGYVLARGPLDNSVAMLLGLSSVELEGLIEAEALLGKLHPGLLRARKDDDRSRLARVRRRYLASNGLVDRVQWCTPHHGLEADVLATVLEALRRRCRLIFDHHDHRDDTTDLGQKSPARLIWHAEVIYLAAWCHGQDALGLYDVSRIRRPQLVATSAFLVDPEHIDRLVMQATPVGITAKPSKPRRR
jgi:predicted DNA-binding transcriptional regulator YafY